MNATLVSVEERVAAPNVWHQARATRSLVEQVEYSVRQRCIVGNRKGNLFFRIEWRRNKNPILVIPVYDIVLDRAPGALVDKHANRVPVKNVVTHGTRRVKGPTRQIDTSAV